MNEILLPPCPSLIDVVRRRALHNPEKTSCIFLHQEREEQMTYGELDQQARAIAASLQARGAKAGDRVILLFGSGLPLIKAFFGCLYAGCIAVPIHPPAQEKLMEKAHRILASTKPSQVLMTAEDLLKYAVPDQANQPRFEKIPALAIDQLINETADQWQPNKIHDQDIALLQYTSGSTMHPKGVMVSHGNLLDNVDKIYTAFHMNDQSVGFSWLPPHHNTGLIGSILTLIYGGVPLIMMSPFAFLQNPLSWLKNITKYKVTISCSPNFAFDYCVKLIKEEKKAGLDLSSWQIAANGSEPVRDETMEHFYQAFKNYGFHKKAFYPSYGLAEATLLVATGTQGKPYKTVYLAKEEYKDHRVHFVDANASDSHALVSCGKIIQPIKIVDPETLHLCDNDQVGEIWVHSPSVAKGYWNQPEETHQTFAGTIETEPGNTTYLRTGDLGFIHEGELYVTGRIKDLIILYGKNHYPQDIEHSILHSPLSTQISSCAAFVTQEHHEYKLILMCEIKNTELDAKERKHLFTAIFRLVYQNHQLEVNTIILLPEQAIPQTASGKVSRSFCRKHLLDNTLPVIASWHLDQIED